MTDRSAHWEDVYASRHAHEVSWYQVRPELSLRLVETLGIGAGDPVIDVGGGASSLVDNLIERGFRDLTVVDISATALAAARQRLGARAAAVHWLVGDVTSMTPRRSYRLWHDRAVFHFLTEAEDRRKYVALLAAALAPDGRAVIATFAEDGPERCSNLPVRRYGPAQLAAEFAPHLELIDSQRETHTTPAQGQQKFVYCSFRRAASPASTVAMPQPSSTG